MFVGWNLHFAFESTVADCRRNMLMCLSKFRMTKMPLRVCFPYDDHSDHKSYSCMARIKPANTKWGIFVVKYMDKVLHALFYEQNTRTKSDIANSSTKLHTWYRTRMTIISNILKTKIAKCFSTKNNKLPSNRRLFIGILRWNHANQIIPQSEW